MAQLPEGDAPFLDHVGHFVLDLDAVVRVLEVVGFALTPRTRRRNLTDAGLAPSGTSNRCIMLEAGYVETLAATDDTPLARLRPPASGDDHARHQAEPGPFIFAGPTLTPS